MDNNERVRTALAKARAKQAEQSGRVPGLDATVAVLNADNIDRDRGTTFKHERTPGLALAHRIVR